MNDRLAKRSSFSAGEIDVALLTTEDLTANPGLLDGFHPCPGCDTVFILPERRYCANCTRMWGEFEARQASALPRPQQPRTDMGVVPHDTLATYDPGKSASRIAVGLIFFGALCSLMFMLTGMWYTGCALIGLWQHGW